MKAAIPVWPFKVRKWYPEQILRNDPGVLRIKTNLQSFNINLPILTDHILAVGVASPDEGTYMRV